jgi:hypothetical protein
MSSCCGVIVNPGDHIEENELNHVTIPPEHEHNRQ